MSVWVSACCYSVELQTGLVASIYEPCRFLLSYEFRAFIPHNHPPLGRPFCELPGLLLLLLCTFFRLLLRHPERIKLKTLFRYSCQCWRFTWCPSLSIPCNCAIQVCKRRRGGIRRPCLKRLISIEFTHIVENANTCYVRHEILLVDDVMNQCPHF